MTTRTLIEHRSGTFDIHRHARSTVDFAAAGMRFIVQALRTMRHREHLHAMPDSLLKDIGISRSQIDQAVMFGRQIGNRRGSAE